MSGKYAPLTLSLSALPYTRDDVTLSFDEIQSILGFQLPRSATEYRPWWANQVSHENRPQARGWMDAGFHVDSVDLRNKWVRFVRTGSRKTASSRGGEPREVRPAEKLHSNPTDIACRAAKGGESARSAAHDRKRIVLISCAAGKSTHRARAADLYVSPLFRRQLAYAQKLTPDAIFILSAKYGLVGLDEEIEPYEKTLKDMGVREQRSWAQSVLARLKEEGNLSEDHFIFLAGDAYRKHLTPALQQWEAPLEGLTIGRQLRKLDQLLHE